MDTKKMENKDKIKKDVKKIRKKYLKLKKEINIHNKLYYDENNPKISDAQYDQLWKELKNLEEIFPFLKTKDSPVTKIGYKPNQNRISADVFTANFLISNYRKILHCGCQS